MTNISDIVLIILIASIIGIIGVFYFEAKRQKNEDED